MLTRQRSSIQWGFLLNWTLMTVFGLVIGMAVRQMIVGLAFGLVGGIFAKAIEGTIVGLALGVSQLLALSVIQLERGRWWILASTVGWAIGWSVGWVVGWDVFSMMGFSGVFATMGTIAGALTGIPQWFMLREEVSRAGWWILASTLGWALGLALGMTTRGLLSWPIAGSIAGLLTGGVLLWLAQHPTFE